MKKEILLCGIVATLIIPKSVFAEDELKNTYEIGGIAITAENFTLEDYNDPNGEYDQKAVINFTIKNSTDADFGYINQFQAELDDGQIVDPYIDFSDMALKQVPSSSEKSDKAYVLLKSEMNVETLTAIYPFNDYNEEYWNDFANVMNGGMDMDEWDQKWGKGNYEELKFPLVLSDQTDEDLKSSSDFVYEAEGHTYKYLTNKAVGENVLVYYEYTNNSGSTTTPSNALSLRAYQNGIELQWMMPGYEDVSEEENMAFTNIQDGTTVKIAMIYTLRDDSDISLEISPRMITDNVEIGEYTIPLNK